MDRQNRRKIVEEQTERQTDKQMDRWKKVERQTDRQMYRHAYVEGQADRQTDGRTERQQRKSIKEIHIKIK